MRAAVTLLVLGAVLTGCPSGKSKSSTIPLTDPTTGKVIGHKNPATGELVFNDGSVVDGKRVNAIKDSNIARQLWSESAAVLKNKNTKLPGPGGISWGPQTSPNCGGCTGSCWTFAEGGAMCTGCCEPVGTCACNCWESCTDKMSSSSGTPAK